MCGINGFIKNCKNAEDILKNMNAAIIHRGPDDQGFLVSNNFGNKKIGLGHVRLSIIDLSDAGSQPMYYDKRVGCFSVNHNSNYINKYGNNALTIVFNGEIYNYQDLRRDLIKKGYIFTSKTDTEVVLASYLERGNDCVKKFNGMRSFAIYNPNESEFFCSRDRLGKKPFYYYFDTGQFIFSSEIKGILEHKELKINRKENIDSEAIDFYFTTGFIPSPWTIYKNVKKLEARHNLIINILGNGNLTLTNKCYYEIPEYKPINDKNLLVEEGKKILEETVKDRMFTSDVAVGANLSGGLDSSSAVAEMTNWVDKKKLHTFSIGFEGEYDESKYIHIVESAFGTNHHHEYFKEQDFENMLPKIVYYYDEPFGDISCFPSVFVAKLAQKNVKVVLTGDGGDEIFGGYEQHQLGAKFSMIYKIPNFLKRILLNLVRNANSSFFKKIRMALEISLKPKENYISNLAMYGGYIPEVYKKRTTEKMHEILKINGGNLVQSLIDFDLFYGTLGDNYLTKTDRASMSQSIEYRSPFCDKTRIEWGKKCPVCWKVSGKNTKIIMRDIIKDKVPKEIVYRNKQGFIPPINKWFENPKYAQSILKFLGEKEVCSVIGDKRIHILKENMYKNHNIMAKTYIFCLWYKKWIQTTY